MDKRCRRRVSLKVAGKIEGHNRFSLKGHTRDISAVGAFFDSEETVPVGTNVELEIYLPLEKLEETKRHDGKMKVSGTVVRVEEGGVAVLFRGLKILSHRKGD
jgi:hypothetical protein